MRVQLTPFGPVERFGSLANDVFANDYDSQTGQEKPCMCMRPGCPLCRSLRPETAGYPFSHGNDFGFSLTGHGKYDSVCDE